MGIIKKLGGFSAVYEILKKSGWKYEETTLRMQISRKSLSKEVCLYLTDFMNKNKISYEKTDFYSDENGEEKA